jgi:hypothetical protein
MVSLGLYYERGLLNSFIDYDTPPWLNMLVDPMGDEGNAHISPDGMHGIVRPFPSHHRLVNGPPTRLQQNRCQLR